MKSDASAHSLDAEPKDGRTPPLTPVSAVPGPWLPARNDCNGL
jgi:hypothetical protein